MPLATEPKQKICLQPLAATKNDTKLQAACKAQIMTDIMASSLKEKDKNTLAHIVQKPLKKLATADLAEQEDAPVTAASE